MTMPIDLMGKSLTETFDVGVFFFSGPDPNTYTNTGALATLTLVVAVSDTVTEGVNAITGAIGLSVGAGQETESGVLSLTGANSYSGGTVIGGFGILLSGAQGALGTGGVFFAGANSVLEATVTQTLGVPVEVANATSPSVLAATAGKTLTLNGDVVLGGGAGSTTQFGYSGANQFNAPIGDGTVDLAPSAEEASAGAVVVDDGTLVIGSAQGAALIGAMQGGLTVGDGNASTALDLGGFDLTAKSLAGDSNAFIADGVAGSVTLTVADTASNLFAGIIEDGKGQVALHVASGSQPFILSGANSYSGGTTIDSGATLQIGNGFVSGSIVGAVDDAGVLGFERLDNVTFAGAVSGAGALQQSGNGTLTLTGANTYSGGTNIAAGVLAIGAASAIGTGILDFTGAGGTLDATAGFNLSNAIAVAKGVTATIGETANASLALVSGGGLDVGAGATLNFNSLVTPTEIGAVFLTPGSAANSIGLGATLSVGGGAVLPGNAAGKTMIEAFANVVLGSGTSDSILDLNGLSLTLNNLSGNATGTIQNSTAQAAVLTLADTTTTSFQGNIFNGPGPGSGTPGGVSIVVAGAATSVMILAGANHYSTTTITSGALEVLNTSRTTAVGSLGTGLISIAAGAKLIFANSDRVNDGYVLTDATTGLDQEISGAGALVFAGAADSVTTLDVNDGNFTGATTIESGIVNMEIWNGFGTGVVTMTGGALRATQFPQDISNAFHLSGTIGLGAATNFLGAVTLLGNTNVTPSENAGHSTWSGKVALGAFTLATANKGLNTDGGSWAGAALTISGVVSGKGRLSQASLGELVLTGQNTFTGGTTISEGEISIGDAHALGSRTLTFAGAGALQATFTGALANAVTINSGVAATLGAVAGDTLSLRGAISDAGTLTLSGTTSFLGAVGGSGAVDIGAAKTTVGGLVGAGVTFAFTPAVKGDLVLDDLGGGGQFLGKIANFAVGDTIDLGPPFAKALSGPTTSFVYTENTSKTAGVLALTFNSTTPAVTSLNFTGAYLQADFRTKSDGHGGTLLTYV